MKSKDLRNYDNKFKWQKNLSSHKNKTKHLIYCCYCFFSNFQVQVLDAIVSLPHLEPTMTSESGQSLHSHLGSGYPIPVSTVRAILFYAKKKKKKKIVSLSGWENQICCVTTIVTSWLYTALWSCRSQWICCFGIFLLFSFCWAAKSLVFKCHVQYVHLCSSGPSICSFFTEISLGSNCHSIGQYIELIILGVSVILFT